MANQYKDYRKNEGFDASWLPVFIMLAIFWPIGIIMLINKIRKSSSPEQAQRKPISWMSFCLCAAGFMTFTSGMARMLSVFALLGGGALFAYSRKMKGDEKLFIKYANVIGDRPVVPVKALAAAMPVSYEKALTDLEKMIEQGYFGGHAYVDHGTGMFVSDSRISRNFINRTAAEYGAQLNPDPQTNATAAAQKHEPVKIDPSTEIEREFQQRLDEIRKLNDAIKDDDISNKIYRIEEITGNIFEVVREKPQKRSQIHTFMNYYLPTTVKLLNSYSVLEKQNVLGQNIVSTKDNIAKMVDQLVFAFEQQLDQMFEAEAKDISTDITVLEKMMQRDGLSENNPYLLPKSALTQNRNPSPFSTPADFGTAQAVAKKEERS